MATTGELSAIMEELHLVAIGDAASYLGEEALVAEESADTGRPPGSPPPSTVGARDQSLAATAYPPGAAPALAASSQGGGKPCTPSPGWRPRTSRNVGATLSPGQRPLAVALPSSKRLF